MLALLAGPLRAQDALTLVGEKTEVKSIEFRSDSGLPMRCECKRMSSSMTLPAIQAPIPNSSARCAFANFAAGSTCARTLQKRSAIG